MIAKCCKKEKTGKCDNGDSKKENLSEGIIGWGQAPEENHRRNIRQGGNQKVQGGKRLIVSK